MKKIIFAVMAVVAAIGLVGGAFAYFSDTETSTGNTFSAGYMDMEMSNGTGWHNNDPFVLATASNLAPGEESGPHRMYLRNIGNVSGKVKVYFSYVDSDVPVEQREGEFANYINVNSDDFAKALIVKEAYLDGTDDNKAKTWVNSIAAATGYPGDLPGADTAGIVYNDPDEGYVPTLYGLTRPGIELKFYVTGGELEWTKNVAHYEDWTFKLDPDANNDYMFDGVNITLTANMIQFADEW